MTRVARRARHRADMRDSPPWSAFGDDPRSSLQPYVPNDREAVHGQDAPPRSPPASRHRSREPDGALPSQGVMNGVRVSRLPSCGATTFRLMRYWPASAPDPFRSDPVSPHPFLLGWVSADSPCKFFVGLPGVANHHRVAQGGKVAGIKEDAEPCGVAALVFSN